MRKGPGVIVEKVWPGATVVCIAPGPSLTREDAEYCRGKARVIAVGTAYRLAQWADAIYHCDAKFWRWNAGVPEFSGLKYSMEATPKGFGVGRLAFTGASGLEMNPGGLRSGQNSGYQAVNLAVHLGAARIVLLGYDMKLGPKRQQHFDGGDHLINTPSPYDKFLIRFASLVEPLRALGIPVVNCTPGSALRCFPMQPLRQALPASIEVAA